MRRKVLFPGYRVVTAGLTVALALAGCAGCAGSSQPAASSSQATSASSASSLEDGVYTVDVTTDSDMFHVNEALGGKGRLTVKDGTMTLHMTLASTGILHLYPGTAEEAQKEGAQLLDPTTDTVTYDDGTTEEVYGFDLPVPALDQDFDVALVGKKGKWYDHKVKVSNPQKSDTSQDQEAADAVAQKIDAIYVQERTDQTDQQCSDAKAAWDALTDTQKALVEGEHADPDYFGRDTGDAAKDDPLNEDNIGQKEILVASFGTSFNDSRVATIGGIEKALQAAYPDWSVRRAFTAQIIINHIQARDGEKIDNVQQALDRAVANGVKELVVQPTHLMHGAEYDELAEALRPYESKMRIVVAEPLLGQVGSDATVINADKQAVALDVTAAAVADAGYQSLDAAAADGTAFVFMGHGTSHEANVTYDQMQAQMENLGYKNVFVGTVEGKPEDTSCEAVIQKVKGAGYQKVQLRPLMVVAGDHANNDMAGDDDDSWKSQMEAAGLTVTAQIKGLGQIPQVQQIYVDHTKAAMAQLG